MLLLNDDHRLKLTILRPSALRCAWKKFKKKIRLWVELGNSVIIHVIILICYYSVTILIRKQFCFAVGTPPQREKRVRTVLVRNENASPQDDVPNK